MRERMEDWGNGLCRVLDKKLVELTGDITPDIRCGLGRAQLSVFSAACTTLADHFATRYVCE